MDIFLSADLSVLGCSLIGVIISVATLLKNYNIMYLRMICWAVICAFCARLFHVVYLVFYSQIDFNISMATMGVFGSLLFLLSANYGQIDGLVDDGSPRCKRARIIALIGPLVIIGMYAFFYYYTLGWEWHLNILINVGIVGVIVIPCIYYNFKHLIIYDVEGGIVKSLRLYNALAVIYELMIMGEWLSMHMVMIDLYRILLIVQGIVLLLIVPVARRGVKKWTI